MNISAANRGRVLEELITLSNRQFRVQGRAVIHKVPTAWLPLRSGGHIAGAKVEEKAAVDFLGTYRGRPIAFDAKQCGDNRIRWERLEPHQCEFLRDWEAAGGHGFILVGFGMSRFFMVPAPVWFGHAAMAIQKRGPASTTAEQMDPEWEISYRGRLPLDYLAVVDRWMS